MNAHTNQWINPWKGLYSYNEDDQAVFFGRAKEVLELFRLLKRDCLTTLFARSGMGKTSLLRAGLIPLLRKEDYLPAIVRIIPGEGLVPPSQQITEALQQAAREHEVDIEDLVETSACTPETLWEYFHRHRFWSKRNDPITPVVILDQFEELFTLGHGSTQTTALLEELADLVENRMPSQLQQYLEVHEQKLGFDPRFHDYKILFSLREDFLPFLDRLQPSMPSVMRNRYCLAPMLRPAAVEIVQRAGGSYVSSEVAEQIASAVTANQATSYATSPEDPLAPAEVEPAYLSVMCHELCKRMLERNAQQIDGQLVSEESGNILSNLYYRSFENLPTEVRTFVEDRLLSDSGYRLTRPLEDADKAGISRDDLQQLVDHRLLRFEYRLGTNHVELSHDLLRQIVVKSRTQRQQELEQARRTREQEEIKRKLLQSKALALAGATTTTVLLAGISLYLLGFKIDSSSYSAEFTTKWGVPYPIRALPWGAEFHRNATVKITRKGWWGPVKKLEMINANAELTDQHNVKTILAPEDEAPKPRAEFAYKEFSYDKDGRLVLETQRDRNGKVVSSLAYSTPPPAAPDLFQEILQKLRLSKRSDAEPKAKAFFLGPDGFPLAQRQSKAEYIEFTYDRSGNEEKRTYFSLTGKKMPGPDNAFGRLHQYDAQDKLVKMTSIGVDGTVINDKAGNASLEIIYNSNGDVIQQRALDAQDQPTNTVSGVHSALFAYDKYGRLTQASFYSPDGRPVREKEDYGAHLIRYSYDNRGNAIRIRYFDESENPAKASGKNLFSAHEWRTTFNSLNQQVSIRFYDEDGQKSSPNGSHEQRYAYDENGHLKSVSYFDEAGKPIALAATGVHQQIFSNDPFGQWVSVRFLDVLGRPVNSLDEGYSNQDVDYDRSGNIIRRRYYDTSVGPVSNRDFGAHDYHAEYDRFGNLLSESYFDAKGQPVDGRDGYHRVVSTYNDSGLLEEQSWLNAKNQPVKGPDGAYLVRYDYDQNGLLVRKRNSYRPVVQPLANREGIAESRYAYNAKQQQTQAQFFGAQGEPVEDSEGNYLILQEYDAKGNTIKTTKKRRDGSPNLFPDLGVATRATVYNQIGDWVENCYTNSTGQLVVGPEGFAKAARTLGPGLKEILVYYGADGKIAFNNLLGVAKRSTDRSAGSLVPEESYYAPDGKLANGPMGYAQVRRLRSEDDAIREEIFYGPGGLPAVGPQGFHRMLKAGPQAQPTYYDAQNRPLVGFNPEAPDFPRLANLIYIHEISSMQSPALRIGFKVGDILWRYGDWSYTRSRKALSSAGRDPEIASIANQLIAEIQRRSSAPTEATLFRDGQLITIPIPAIAEGGIKGGIGVRIRARFVPRQDLSRWGVKLQ